MLNIPDNILVQYGAILKEKVMDVSRHADYKKWVTIYPTEVQQRRKENEKK